MNLLKSLMPKHADDVLRVFCPKRSSTVAQDCFAVDAEWQDDATWLGCVYADPVDYCHAPGDSDKSISSLMAMIDNDAFDLVLVGDLRDLTRNSIYILMFADHCVDQNVRLIAWREGIDTASDGWETALHTAVLRSGMHLETKRRRRRRVVASKA